MGAYENLAASYDRLTNDVDYEATVEFYNTILAREGLHPRTAADLACGTGSVSRILARQGIAVRAGLHCAPCAHESAGTLATGTVRVSFGYDTHSGETDALLHAVSKFLRQPPTIRQAQPGERS